MTEWLKWPENKPEQDGFHLVTYWKNDPGGHRKHYVGSMEFFDGSWYTDTRCFERDSIVLAFMPMPEPYKEEGNE